VLSSPAVLLLTLAAAPAPTTSVDDLAWMAGGWRVEDKGEITEEHWTAPGGASMIGLSRTVAGRKTTEFEFLRIETRADGLYYMASPGGARPTPFKLIESARARAVFENKEHDFPQRILYWRDGERLCARIEGLAHGKPASQDWCYGAIR
jgi:Domain of unknown function (DUF6265)